MTRAGPGHLGGDAAAACGNPSLDISPISVEKYPAEVRKEVAPPIGEATLTCVDAT